MWGYPAVYIIGMSTGKQLQDQTTIISAKDLSNCAEMIKIKMRPELPEKYLQHERVENGGEGHQSVPYSPLFIPIYSLISKCFDTMHGLALLSIWLPDDVLWEVKLIQRESKRILWKAK